MALQDVSEMLTAEERDKADKWKASHGEKCPKASYIVVSSSSGYGFRLRLLCTTCQSQTDVSGAGRDPIPKK